MEKLIDREVLRRELANQDHGSMFYDALESLLLMCDEAHELKAYVWCDHGVRDEEGVPSEYEEPAVHITLAAMFLGRWHGRIENIPPHAIPIVAAALEPQIVAAIGEAADQVTEWRTRFETITQELAKQRFKVQALRLNQENPCAVPSAP